MTPGFTITRVEPYGNGSLVSVYFTFDVCSEGSVVVHKNQVGTQRLNDVIQLRLDRLQDQQEQLAAGGD